MKLTASDGSMHTLTVEVPPDSGGYVYIRAADGRPWRVDPVTISRLRKVYAEALAVALQDRGEW